MRIGVRVATGADAEPVARLFERADAPCYCQYHDFEGDHRAWQNRCANERDTNRRELAGRLEDGRLHALVAFDEREPEVALGWGRIERAERLPKTYQGRLYRGLPCFEGDRRAVWTVACFLVDPALRRRGIATELLAGAIAHAVRLGAVALEGLPRGAADTSDEEQWTGPRVLYEREGFERVHDFAPYPVFRLELGARPAAPRQNAARSISE